MDESNPIGRTDFVLATLSLLKEGSTFSPVQVQKLFFLLDREIPEKISGPRFTFSPYDYGPFDVDVYRELEALSRTQCVEILQGNGHRLYRLSDTGRARGNKIAALLDTSAREYIENAGNFVLRLNFKQLVTSIYKSYPEMKAKSIFQE